MSWTRDRIESTGLDAAVVLPLHLPPEFAV